MNDSLRLPCPTCSGTRSTTTGDRHADTNMDVCATCHDEGTIPARPGESPEASFQLVNRNIRATEGKDFPKTGMSFPELGNEARTVLAGKIANARRYADSEGFMLSTLCLPCEDTDTLIAALSSQESAVRGPVAAGALETALERWWNAHGIERHDAKSAFRAGFMATSTPPAETKTLDAGAQAKGWQDIKTAPSEPDCYHDLPGASDSGLGYATNSVTGEIEYLLWWECTGHSSSIVTHWHPKLAGPTGSPALTERGGTD